MELTGKTIGDHMNASDEKLLQMADRLTLVEQTNMNYKFDIDKLSAMTK